MNSVKMVLSLYLMLATILAQFCSAYFFSKGKASYRRAFSALHLCISIYLFGYLMIINSSSLSEMQFWNRIQYLGLPFVSVLWLTVALLYTRTIYSLKFHMSLLLFTVPILTVFIRQTNPWHHLFYASWGIKEYYGNPALYMEWGPWYYVNITYTMLCLLLTVIVYFIGYLKNKAGYTKSHFLIFFFASLLPFLGIAMVLLVFDEWSIDYSALIIPVSLLITSYGILRYDFLEIRTLAREAIFEDNSAGMVVLGPGKRIVDYNKAAEQFFGAMNIQLSNNPVERVLKREPKLLEIFQSASGHEFCVKADGEERFFYIDAVPLGDPQDGSERMLKSIRDVTEEKKLQEKLKFLATIDSLSGIYNRAEFMELARKELAAARSENADLALLIMDLDNFKSINDTFGHAAGDEVIREIGSIIKSSFRETDIPGRLGGEEFAVVLKNASLADAKKLAEEFRETVANLRVPYDQQEIDLTVSIGVAATGGNTAPINDIGDILRMADAALYRAKAMGRNSVAL